MMILAAIQAAFIIIVTKRTGNKYNEGMGTCVGARNNKINKSGMERCRQEDTR
jgi:hypothetical protein